jgi:hypothetical protein
MLLGLLHHRVLLSSSRTQTIKLLLAETHLILEGVMLPLQIWEQGDPVVLIQITRETFSGALSLELVVLQLPLKL